MGKVSLEILDKSIDEAYILINLLADELGEEETTAYIALSATLKAIRDNMGPEKAALLGIRLPLLTRAIFFEDWDPSERVTYTNKLDFLERIGLYLGNCTPVKPETIAPTVLKILYNRFPAKLQSGMLEVLPEFILEFWPSNN